jgi:hypothetical protein
MSPRDLSAPEPRAQRLDLGEVLGAETPDRLTLACTAYLLLPGLMFLGGWAQGWAMLLAGGAAVAALALSPGWRSAWPEGLRTTLLCLAGGLLWAAFTGAGHWIYATADWQIRDAVLRDLASYPWPVAYDEEVVWLLRAPLGFFLPAGLVGRFAGFAASQVALWLWTGLGLTLLLLLLSRLARSCKVRLVPLAALFMVFGGVDILPNLVLDHLYGTGPLASWGRGGEWWARAFQYPGHVTSLLWAPNHTMPAWLGALLLLRHGRTRGFAAGMGLLRGRRLLGAGLHRRRGAAGGLRRPARRAAPRRAAVAGELAGGGLRRAALPLPDRRRGRGAARLDLPHPPADRSRLALGAVPRHRGAGLGRCPPRFSSAGGCSARRWRCSASCRPTCSVPATRRRRAAVRRRSRCWRWRRASPCSSRGRAGRAWRCAWWRRWPCSAR